MTTKIIGIIRDILFFIAFIMLIICCNRCKAFRNENLKLDVDLKAMQDSIHRYHLKDGSSIAEKRSLVLDIDQYKKAVLTTKAEKRQLAKRVGNLNRLTSELRLKLTAKQHLAAVLRDTVMIVKHDTVHAGTFFYADRFMVMKGILLNDSCNVDYHFDAGLSIAAYYRRDGLLKPEYPVINIRSDNPHLVISGLDSYVIQKKTPFYQTRAFCFGAGMAAGILLSHR